MKVIKKLAIVVLDDKGGIQKTGNSACFVEWARHRGLRVKIIDTDMSNQTMAQWYKAERIRVADDKDEFLLPSKVKLLLDDSYDVLIVDSGARSDQEMRSVIEAMYARIQGHEVAVLAVRPVTLNVANQNNALRFAERYKDYQIPIIFMRSECCGMPFDDYHIWSASKRVLNTREYVEEVALLDFSPYIFNWAQAVSLNLKEVAERRFENAPEQFQELIARVFPDYRTDRVDKILRMQIDIIDGAVRTALQKRAMHYGR